MAAARFEEGLLSDFVGCELEWWQLEGQKRPSACYGNATISSALGIWRPRPAESFTVFDLLLMTPSPTLTVLPVNSDD